MSIIAWFWVSIVVLIAFWSGHMAGRDYERNTDLGPLSGMIMCIINCFAVITLLWSFANIIIAASKTLGS